MRALFRRYLELQSVRALMAEANAQRFAATRAGRRKRKSGAVGNAGNRSAKDVARHKHAEGPPAAAEPHPPTRTFTRGHLYHLLSNPIYIGKVRHKGVIHEGEHEAIIKTEIFEQAQRLLATQAPARRASTNATDLHLLTGLLHDEEGSSLRSVHTKKGDVRYRYYVSRALVEERGKSDQGGWRLPAREIEQVVEAELTNLFSDHRRLADHLQDRIRADRVPTVINEASKLLSVYRKSPPHHRRETIRRLVTRIDLAPAMMVVRLDRTGLAEALGCPADDIDANTGASADTLNIECPITLRRRGKETKIVLVDRSRRAAVPDATLLKLVRKAHQYLAQLTDGSGRGIGDIAEANGVDRSDVGRAFRLAFLAPTIVDRIVAGSQPADLTARKLARLLDLPLSWSEQEMLLGR